MNVAVVGGGICGLFTAYSLERYGSEVTLFEPGPPGGRSVHAAGIIEPAAAYRTNTLAFLRRVLKLWRRQTCTFRRVDGRWLLESLRVLEQAPVRGMEDRLLEMGTASMKAYEDLAARSNDFGFTKRGVLETYDDAVEFAKERRLALARRAVTPVEVREIEGAVGGLFYPEVACVDTRRLIARLLRELARTEVVPERVTRVSREGEVTTREGTRKFERVALCSGVSSRTLGIPLTGVRGYGWLIRTSTPVNVATISADTGIALVPADGLLKATGGWDFDLSTTWSGADRVLRQVRSLIQVEQVVEFSEGSRPCTPDGLPTVGRKGSLVAANGGFRLGWSFAPAMGDWAARLCLNEVSNDPFLARFCDGLHGGRLA